MEAINLTDYDVVLVNSSAGKDSQAMLDRLVELADAQGFPRAQMVVVHADLGRVEWEGTRELAEEQARHYGLRFEVVSRRQGDLLDHVQARGMWPSNKARYCTSDHKRGQVARVLTMLADEARAAGLERPVRILNCLGIRAQESSARAKKVPFQRDARATNGRRIVDTWYPIFEWLEPEVWARIAESGVRHHPAYDLGMPRLSCCFCIFAPKKALEIAGRQNRALLEAYVKVEAEIGHRFRQDLSLAEVLEAIDAGAEFADDLAAWNPGA